MNKFSPLFPYLALIMVLLTTACGAQGGATPTPIGTLLPDMTGTPLATTGTDINGAVDTASPVGTVAAPGGLETATLDATGIAATQNAGTLPGTGTQVVGTLAPVTTRTAVIPVTGQDIMLVECQFCVETRAHALLVLPDTATFHITSPATSGTTSDTTAVDSEPRCTTVEVNNGRQVVLCSGPEMTPLVVNICTDASTCKDVPVDLLACPLSQGGQVGPTPTKAAPGKSINTAVPATPTIAAGPTSTPVIGISTPTP
jgi:hypothetical protein